MTANNSKSYLVYLNKLVDEYNNTYHHSIDKKPIDADYSALTEKLNQITKHLNLKLVGESGFQPIEIFLGKVIPRISQKNYL